VRNYPVATKRVLRAILKANDLCATEPARAARQLVDGRFTDRYDYALQTLTELPYDKWRDYDPEDSLRFYALRLREAGMTKSSPQKIIADGTDWRFLNELKHELKARNRARSDWSCFRLQICLRHSAQNSISPRRDGRFPSDPTVWSAFGQGQKRGNSTRSGGGGTSDRFGSTAEAQLHWRKS
jgi:hypothetical protein